MYLLELYLVTQETFIVQRSRSEHSTPQIISSRAKEREENATGAAISVNKERPSTSAGVKRGCKEVVRNRRRENEEKVTRLMAQMT